MTALDTFSKRMARAWLVLFACLFVLYGFFATQLFFSYKSFITNETQRLVNQAEIVQKNFGQLLQTTSNALDVLRIMTQAEGITAKSGVSYSEWLKRFQQSLQGVRSLVIVDADGTTIASNRDELVGLSAKGSSRYETIRSGNDPSSLYISQPYVSPLNKYTISLGRVVQDPEGRFNGYVLATIDPEYYGVLFSSVLQRPDSVISLTHQTGQMFYRIPGVTGDEIIDLRNNPSALIWQFEQSPNSLLLDKAIMTTTKTLRYIAMAKIAPATIPSDAYLVMALSSDAATVNTLWFKEQLPAIALIVIVTLLAISGQLIYQRRQAAFERLKAAAEREKQVADERLRQSNELLTLSEQAAGAGAWTWEINSGQFHWSDRLYRLLGLDPNSSVAGLDTWRKTVHPDDVLLAEKDISDSLRDHAPFHSSYRVIRPNGELIWIDAYGNPTYDADGNPIRLAGICVDATSRHIAEEEKARSDLALRQLNELLVLSEQAAGAGAWSWKIDDDHLYWSDELFRLYGLDPATSKASFETYHKILHPDDRAAGEKAMAESLRDHKPFMTSFRIVRPNGETAWIDSYGKPSYDANGNPVRFAGICVDATSRHTIENRLRESEQQHRNLSKDLEKLNAELEKKVADRTADLEAAVRTLEQFSRRDPLTGLPNRLAANERLRSEFLRMKRTGKVYAVMMLDIDHFKAVNDTCGHSIGDQVLQLISHTMRTSLRENDFVCRYGGEEFLIILPATSLEEATLVAEKVRSAVAVEKDPVAGTITISIGLAIATTNDADEDTATKLADEMLYEAKRGGRNRVVAGSQMDRAVDSAG